MRTLLTIIMALSFTLDVRAGVEDLQLGDSRETVYQVLGKPRSYIQYDQTELMYYDRGKLELKNGVVSLLEMMDDKTFAAYQKRLIEEARKRELEAQRRAAERFAVGSMLREKKLEDFTFMTSSAKQRVAYWSAFKKKYPEVDVSDEYGEALAEREVELLVQAARAAEEQRIAALEKRVAEAEARAQRAEAAARVDTYYAGYTPTYYPSPTVYYPSSYSYGCAPTYNSYKYRSTSRSYRPTHSRTVTRSHYGTHGHASYGRSTCSTPSTYVRASVAF